MTADAWELQTSSYAFYQADTVLCCRCAQNALSKDLTSSDTRGPI